MGVDFKEREEFVVSTNWEMNQRELGSESVYRGFDSFGSSSSSDLSTLIGSEMDSTEIESDDDEDDEFMAELTRQMADYMLQEDEDVHIKDELKATTENCDSPDISNEQGVEGTFVNSSSVEDSNNIGFQPIQAFTGDQMQPIQLYQVENQPKVSRNSETIRGTLGRRGKKIESLQQFHYDKKPDLSPNMGRGAHDLGNCGKANYPISGSGMRAVFLGGLGSRNTSSGTGVFLPRAISSITPDPVPRSKKPAGCSTVLIPTRVLQALEQHFSNLESPSPSSGFTGRPTQHGRGQNIQRKGQKQQSQQQEAAMDHQESQLPQEWTYEL